MNDPVDGYRTLLTVIWALNVVLEIGVLGFAFFRFRASPAGLLLGGATAAIVVVSIFSRALRWLSPTLSDPSSTGGLVVFGATSLMQWVLLVLVGVGILLIPSSIDKLARTRR